MSCDNLGAVDQFFGSIEANYKGKSHLLKFSNSIDVDEVIGMSIVIQSNDDPFGLNKFDAACGTIVEVPCPHFYWDALWHINFALTIITIVNAFYMMN